ncbi:Retrotransposon-derived protein PEG10 [Smittium culicis]|uniref:Retrotransposon-derived protein PEG10 n=1 Tax=Smittium culicis TaxID=133412 RepID=A0A1R1XCJ2_9FUNG|nr:Retrotransposon-derived protein PEG10 [Smittium culicis]
MEDQVKYLTEQLCQLATENELLRMQRPKNAPKIALPERYDGKKNEYRGFVNQCNLLFFLHPQEYPTDAAKVGLIFSLLTGDALRWASPLLENNNPAMHHHSQFMKEFSKVFDDPQREKTANDAIRSLRQGKEPVANYASEFRRLAMDLDWNESALVSQFEEGLNDDILDVLAQAETPVTLESFIEMAIRTDTRLAKRKEQKSRKSKGTTNYASYTALQPSTRGEPM